MTTMTPSQQQQQPEAGENTEPSAASPSRPPPAPIPLTPGPRASRLQDIYSKALRATLKSNSYENFAACFPTPARHVPASLESVHRQLNAKLEESATAEFNEIIKEREVIKGLNELDRLVGEAKRRKSQGESESAVPYVLLPPPISRKFSDVCANIGENQPAHAKCRRSISGSFDALLATS